MYPYDSNIFSDRVFLSSYVTDRNISDEAASTQELHKNISQTESTKAHLHQHSVLTNQAAQQGPTYEP